MGTQTLCLQKVNLLKEINSLSFAEGKKEK